MKLFLSLLLLFIVSISKGQFAFEKAIAVTNQTYAGRAIEALDHSIFYCGTYYDSTVGHLIVGKLDFQGNEIWQSLFDTDVGSCWGLVQLGDNNIVIGYDKDNYMVLLKVSENGDSLTSVHVNPAGSTDAYLEGSSLDATESDVLFFSAFEHGINPFGYPYAGALYARYSSLLSLIAYWVPENWICGSTATSYPSQVKCESNERFLYGVNLIGSFCAPQANLGVMNSNGDSIWLRNLWIRNIVSIDVNEGGDCFVSSNYYVDTSYVARYDSLGNRLWEDKLNYDGNIHVASSPDNGVIVSCSSVSLNRYDENGNYLWTHQIGNGYYLIEVNNLERCHDDSYLGSATVQDSSSLDYSIYLFRTQADGILGVEDEPNLTSSRNSFRVFPIPANGFCKIEIDHCNNGANQCLHIKDLLGRILYSTRPVNCETLLDLTKFPKGIYMAELLNDKDDISSQLFIVQ